VRAEQIRKKQPPRYDRRCRELSPKERAQFEAQGIIPVIRFKTPLNGETRFYDLIRGEVAFHNSTLDDFVLLKSDSYPTYHLANVVDDHLMQISHVLRADEWLPSTPRHVLLYHALGYEPPLFAHLPMILGPDRSKLSKRHGAVSVLDYRERGYLPEAVVNFLALLGWSLDDRTELITRDELVRHFSIERISKTGAIFNLEKLNWMNGVYIRSLSAQDFVEHISPFLEAGLPKEVERPISRGYVEKIAPLIQERITTLAEAAGYAEFFFVDELEYEHALLLGKDMTEGSATEALQAALERLEALHNFDAPSLENALRPLAGELGLKTGQLFGLLRVAITGRSAAPPLFQTMAALGRERCLRRIKAALMRLRSRV
jgi:glutamyl-tRNA synthetase